MYCPNCNKEFEGKFCPECGTKLIEKPASNATAGINLNLGDANAISGGLNITDSHDVHNIDNSVHNISNVNNVTQHITNHIIERHKTSSEIKNDKKKQYLALCREAYEDLVLTSEELAMLESKRMELNLTKEEADNILKSVRRLAMHATMTSPLSGIAKLKLKQFSDAILNNNMESLQKLIDSIAILAEKNLNEELQYKCYMVMSALKPETCISKYESASIDNYWMMYWSYFAYLNTGRSAEAEELIITITDKFSSYPEDNATTLAAAGILVQEGVEAASEYLDMITGESSPLLQRFQEALLVVSGRMDSISGHLDFYLNNLLKVWDDSDKEARETAAAERAAAEEMARIIEEAKADERFGISADGGILHDYYDEYAESCIIPRCIKTIDEYVFANNSYLKEIALPPILKKIGVYAFGCCDALESIVIPEGVDKIEETTFQKCTSLKEISLPSTLKIISKDAFCGCDALESIVIPEGVEKIEASAFKNCTSLKDIILPSTLKKIGKSVFCGCEALESVVIPEGVEEIGAKAFIKCNSLKEVLLPSTLKKIGIFAFLETALHSICVSGNVEIDRPLGTEVTTC